jgi:hypothetical protein
MEWTHETEGFQRLSDPPITTWRTVRGCDDCLNRLGTSDDGRPWREAMVPRAALEALAIEHHMFAVEHGVGTRGVEAIILASMTAARDEDVDTGTLRAALKAAEDSIVAELRDALATIWAALDVDAKLAIEREFDAAALQARRAFYAAENTTDER